MADTEIEWATKVWNFVRGCRRVSPGCGGALGQGGCYAEKTAYRFSGPGMPYEGLVRLGKHGPQWTGKGRFVADKLAEPLSWRAPRDGSRHRIFVNSMSDLFFEEFSNEEIAAGFGVMAACPQHDFLILTKRPKRAAEWFKWLAELSRPVVAGDPEVRICLRHTIDAGAKWSKHIAYPSWPLPNVWLGVSAEDQATADERIPLLLQLPAATRFVSYEPALGPVDFRCIPANHDGAVGDMLDALSGCEFHDQDEPHDAREPSSPAARGARLDWVIVGGESGNGAREFDLDWARDVVQECAAARVPVFVKQMGARPLDGEHGAEECRVPVKLKDSKGGEMSEWSPDLRVRQFPEARQ